jgi:hypothetical protein
MRSAPTLASSLVGFAASFPPSPHVGCLTCIAFEEAEEDEEQKATRESKVGQAHATCLPPRPGPNSRGKKRESKEKRKPRVSFPLTLPLLSHLLSLPLSSAIDDPPPCLYRRLRKKSQPHANRVLGMYVMHAKMIPHFSFLFPFSSRPQEYRAGSFFCLSPSSPAAARCTRS